MLRQILKCFLPGGSGRLGGSVWCVMVILSVGVGLLLTIQIFLTAYSNMMTDKILESRDELFIIANPLESEGFNLPDATASDFRDSSTLSEAKATAVQKTISDRFPSWQTTKIIQTDKFRYVDATGKDGRVLMLGLSNLMYPTMRGLTEKQKSAFFDRSGAEIPVLLAESVSDTLKEGDLFILRFGTRESFTEMPAKVVAILPQNNLFRIEFAYMDVSRIQKILERSDYDAIGAVGLEGRLPRSTKKELESALGNGYSVSHWETTFKVFLNVVAAINIIFSTVVSSIFVIAFVFSYITYDILLMRARKKLAVFLALGMAPSKIRWALIGFGSIISAGAMVCGFVIAWILVTLLPAIPWVQALMEMMYFDGTSFFCDWNMICLTAALTFTTSLFSCWRASRRVFVLDPVEDLRT